MIFFHLLFNLKEIYGYSISYNSGIYYYIGKASVLLFIIISAISCSFSRNNTRRAAKVLLVALLITVVSHLYNPDFGIKFGILHFLGVSILLYPWIKNFNKYILAIAGTMIIILGQYFNRFPTNNNYLFLFNLTDSSWVSADYYPLFPWFGVFLYGIALGKQLYPQKKSLFNHPPQHNVLGFVGQHTLSVYLIHQPVLLLAIEVYTKIVGH